MTMTNLPTPPAAAAYLLGDLVPECHPSMRDALVTLSIPVCNGDSYCVKIDGCRVGDAYYGWTSSDSPTAVRAVIMAVIMADSRTRRWILPEDATCCAYRRSGRSDMLAAPVPRWHDAEALAAKIMARRPMTVEQLLNDPAFTSLAREAAEKGKTYTTELLAWERKPVVVAAVAVMRATVDAERAVAAAKAADDARIAAERHERERPTREAVMEEYEGCGFRTCRHGHIVNVAIGDTVGVSCDTEKGERYSSRCTWRKQESIHVIRVREDYLARLAVSPSEWHDMPVDSLRLDAEPMPMLAADGSPLWRITYARQSRGTSLCVEYMVIDVSGRQYSGRAMTRHEYDAARVGLAPTVPAGILRDAMIDAGLIAE